jgi:SAM-dependent methyltransferase
MMDDYLRANRDRWNELVPIHAASSFYDLETFRAGRCSLDPIEVEEVGDVEGRSLLHLQCHFGQDTLSWARRGARVTGADFSEAAIDLARRLAEELNLDARFVCADIYSLPEVPGVLEGSFDIVYTGGGVLGWLPDLRRWAEVAAHFLRPGGLFYIREFHPFSWVFDDEGPPGELRVRYPYFGAPQPDRWEADGSYADESVKLQHRVTYEWMHPLSDVVNSLIDAGLWIRFLHEFPVTNFRQLPWMVKEADGYWRLPDVPALPLMFSIGAVKGSGSSHS